MTEKIDRIEATLDGLATGLARILDEMAATRVSIERAIVILLRIEDRLQRFNQGKFGLDR